jgi:hypothetical protein
MSPPTVLPGLDGLATLKIPPDRSTTLVNARHRRFKSWEADEETGRLKRVGGEAQKIVDRASEQIGRSRLYQKAPSGPNHEQGKSLGTEGNTRYPGIPPGWQETDS